MCEINVVKLKTASRKFDSDCMCLQSILQLRSNFVNFGSIGRGISWTCTTASDVNFMMRMQTNSSIDTPWNGPYLELHFQCRLQSEEFLPEAGRLRTSLRR